MHIGAGQSQENLDARIYPAQTPWFYLQLSVYWFALSFMWSGLITIVMQSLVARLVGPTQKDLYLGYSLAIGALVSTVVCLVVGTLSDHARWAMGKRRPYMVVGTLFAVPALLWLARIDSITELIIVFCLIQFWVNVATAPYQALVPDLVPKAKQGAAAAYMGMGSLLGQLGGLVLCGYLMQQTGGLNIIVNVLAGLLMFSMIFTLVRIGEQPATHNPVPQSTLVSTLVNSFRVRPSEHPDFFWLIASRFVINLGFYSATEFLLYYVTDTLRAENPVATVMQLFIVTTVSGLLGNFPAGILSDRISKKFVVFVSIAITAVAALVFLLATSIPVAFVAAFVFGAGFGAFAAVDWALATNLLPDHDEAKFMGVWHAAFTVPQVVAPVVGGVIAHFVNRAYGQGAGYRAVLFMVLVYLALGALLLRPVRERIIAPSDSNDDLA